MFEIEFYVKISFFEVLQAEIAQKSQILEISLIFSDFSVEFQFSLIFRGVIEKKF